MNEVDVAVVGAGAAGLAAGKTLHDRGARYVVLEARARSGGRSTTDSTTFPGLSFDRGCHWLHSASINPFTRIADELGFAYNRRNSFDHRSLYLGSRPLGEAQVAQSGIEFDAALAEIESAGATGRDISAAEALRTRGAFLPLIAHVFANITSGDLHEVSALDSSRYRATDEDFPVEAGYGALVAAHAKGVAVETGTPVTRIDWSGRSVRLATERGDIRAKAAIVTASTSVLASDRIRFNPGLPDPLCEAIEACRLGCAEKIVLRLDKPLEDMTPGSFLSFMDDSASDALHPFGFYVNPFGRPLLISHVGGAFGRELIQAGEAEAVAYAKEVLARMFGSLFERRITGATATSWIADPYVGGGYSFARPGRAHLRPRLAEPFTERLLLAGEATSLDSYSTAHGAHLTGIAAAERALTVVNS